MRKKLELALSTGLQDINKKFNHISSGGCGIFASILAKELNRIGLEATLHIVYRSKSDSKPITTFLKNNQQYNENTKITDLAYRSWSHVMVKCNKRVIDNHGVFTSIKNSSHYQNYLLTKTPISSEVLDIFCDDNNRSHWNRMFDREQIPKLKKEVKKLADSLYKYSPTYLEF